MRGPRSQMDRPGLIRSLPDDVTHDIEALNRAMRRLADGDPRAFDEVFETLWPILHRYTTSVLGDSSRGEDAAQKALLKMFERASTYDPNRSALGWAMAFAFWECRTEKSRLRRAKTNEVGLEIPSSEESQEEVLGRRQWERAAKELLEALPAEERALLLANAQPAALEGQNPATVRKRRQRLVGRLRAALRMVLALEDEA